MAGKMDESSLDALAASCKTLEDVALLYTQMLQRVIDRGSNAELDAHDHLHDQRYRALEHDDAQIHAQPAYLPERRVSDEVAVPGHPGSEQTLAWRAPLEAGHAGLPDTVRRRTRTDQHELKWQLHSWIYRPFTSA